MIIAYGRAGFAIPNATDYFSLQFYSTVQRKFNTSTWNLSIKQVFSLKNVYSILCLKKKNYSQFIIVLTNGLVSDIYIANGLIIRTDASEFVAMDLNPSWGFTTRPIASIN